MDKLSKMGHIPEGIYTQEQIDWVNSVKEEHLRDTLLHVLRLKDNIAKDRDSFENECNTMRNIILDVRQMYPDLKVPTMKETVQKHGELPTYVNKYKT